MRLLSSILFLVAAASAQTPTIVSLTPANGSKTSALFTVVATDPQGASDMFSMQVMVNHGLDVNKSCIIGHDLRSNRMSLLNDTASGWTTVMFGSGTTVSNGQCSINGIQATSSTVGNNYNWTFKVTFKPSFSGFRQIHAHVWDVAQNGLSVWTHRGYWIVPDIDVEGVTGLRSDLDARITRGTGYVAGRAARINDYGQIEAVAGSASGCVRTLGNSSPCAIGTRTERLKVTEAGPHILQMTVPRYSGSEPSVYRNGILLYPEEDYTIVGDQIHFPDLGAGDLLQAVYQVLL